MGYRSAIFSVPPAVLILTDTAAAAGLCGPSPPLQDPAVRDEKALERVRFMKWKCEAVAYVVRGCGAVPCLACAGAASLTHS